MKKETERIHPDVLPDSMTATAKEREEKKKKDKELAAQIQRERDAMEAYNEAFVYPARRKLIAQALIRMYHAGEVVKQEIELTFGLRRTFLYSHKSKFAFDPEQL